MQKSDNYNPDVLTCLANLSSDEVFTPPQLANQVLDLLPKDVWRDKNARFLDPVCKSGVFLREIARRLDVGLEKEIPDKKKRINHIFKNQLFGIAITELTALFSRRSLYCSKKANGKYSVRRRLMESIPYVSFLMIRKVIFASNGSSIGGKTVSVSFAEEVRKSTIVGKN